MSGTKLEKKLSASFIYLFFFLVRKKEGKEIIEQCEVTHNFSFSQTDVVSSLVAVFILPPPVPCAAKHIFLVLLKQNPYPSGFRGEFHS